MRARLRERSKSEREQLILKDEGAELGSGEWEKTTISVTSSRNDLKVMLV